MVLDQFKLIIIDFAKSTPTPCYIFTSSVIMGSFSELDVEKAQIKS